MIKKVAIHKGSKGSCGKVYLHRSYIKRKVFICDAIKLLFYLVVLLVLEIGATMWYLK